MPERKRGFEVISKEQWEKDAREEGVDFYYDEIKLPKRMTSGSGGYDFFTPYAFTLNPGETIEIRTGIKAYMQPDEKFEITPRSGLGFKYFLRLANTVGKIDSDYYNSEKTEGHIFIKLRNEGNSILVIEKGEAFAQGSFEKYLLADGDGFTGNKRVGGTGSTG